MPVSKIGIQLLDILQKLHETGILNCDLKPSNIGYGIFDNGKIIKEEQLFLLDFGYSIKYIYHQFEKDEKGNICEIGKYHYLENNNNKIIGTYSFMSQDILDGKLPSRKTELENWFFVLIYLYRGRLPWSDTFQKKIYSNGK